MIMIMFGKPNQEYLPFDDHPQDANLKFLVLDFINVCQFFFVIYFLSLVVANKLSCYL
jgi:hypothetical protein